MKAMQVPRRAGLLVAIAGLLSAFLVGVAPTAAHAEQFPEYDCPEESYMPLGDSHVVEGRWLRVFFVKYWEPTFNKGNGQSLVNESDATDTRVAKFTVTQQHQVQTVESNGFTTSSTVLSIGINRSNRLDKTVTDTLTISKEVTDTFPVQARTALQVDYGVYARNVIFDMDVWKLEGGRCWYYPQYSPRNVTRNFPADEGWRVQTYPRINIGGVINPDGWKYEFHPGTTVAIFGTNFSEPDQVIVRQNNRVWTIEEGSLWWYDHGGQINATLPNELVPGRATISVRASNGLESVGETRRTITIT